MHSYKPPLKQRGLPKHSAPLRAATFRNPFHFPLIGFVHTIGLNGLLPDEALGIEAHRNLPVSNCPCSHAAAGYVRCEKSFLK